MSARFARTRGEDPDGRRPAGRCAGTRGGRLTHRPQGSDAALLGGRAERDGRRVLPGDAGSGFDLAQALSVGERNTGDAGEPWGAVWRAAPRQRSEERRVGKEWMRRWEED